jgi:translation initiation factor 3 subunit C
MASSPIPPAGHIPPQFLQTIVDLEAGVSKTIASEKTATKKMAGAKAKAVTGLKQTLKKRSKEFEIVLGTFNKDPAAYAAEYEKANVAPVVPKIPKKAAPAAGEEPVEGQDEGFSSVGRGGRVKNFTDKDVLATLKEIAEQRGRKVSLTFGCAEENV